jgi:hypothetical protein
MAMTEAYDDSGVSAFLWAACKALLVAVVVAVPVFIALRVLGVVVSWAFWL